MFVAIEELYENLTEIFSFTREKGKERKRRRDKRAKDRSRVPPVPLGATLFRMLREATGRLIKPSSVAGVLSATPSSKLSNRFFVFFLIFFCP